MDSSRAFRSDLLKRLCAKWRIRQTYRGINRPSGNGIVERNHRTIKRMAARSGSDPLDMVFWYNMAPRNGTQPSSIPARGLFSYSWRLPLKAVTTEGGRSKFTEGDEVVVKPFPMSCTKEWKPGRVTKINSPTNIDVDGWPRHVADIRSCQHRDSDGSDTDEATDSGEEERRSSRPRRPPEHLSLFDVG